MGERPHKDLKAWQQAMTLAEATYHMTEGFPRGERFGLIAQMRRAATSVPTNIAEGCARQSVRETLQFYFVARGSLSELDTLAELSYRVRFCTAEVYERLHRHIIGDVSSLLQGLIRHNRKHASAGLVSITQLRNYPITDALQ